MTDKTYAYNGERDYAAWEGDTLELGHKVATAFRRENEPGWRRWWLFRLGCLHV